MKCFSTRKKAKIVCMRRKRILTNKSSPKTNLFLPISRIAIQILIQDSFESSTSNWHRTRMWNVIATHQRSRYLLNNDKEKRINCISILCEWNIFTRKATPDTISWKYILSLDGQLFTKKIIHNVFFSFCDNLWRHDISIFQNYSCK